MDYLPLVKPADIAVKNTGKVIILKIFGKEYEMRKDTIEQLTEMVNFILKTKHPTGYVSGYEDIKKEEAMELWPVEDNDPIVGA